MAADQNDAFEMDPLNAGKSDDKMDQSNSEWEKTVAENGALGDIWDLVMISFNIRGLMKEIGSISEIGLVITYLKQGYMMAFWTTLGVLGGTYLVMFLLAFLWFCKKYYHSNRPYKTWICPILLHGSGLALQLRKLEVNFLRFNISHLKVFQKDEDQKLRSDSDEHYQLKLNEYKENLKSKEKDVAWFDVFIAAFSSAPKVALQLYLTLTMPFDFSDPSDEILRFSLLFFYGVPFSFSFITLHGILKETNCCCIGLIDWLMKLFTVAPRFFLLTVFISLWPYWAFVIVVAHWFVMFVIFLCNQKQDCCSWDSLRSLGLAWIHIFDFLTCHEKCSACICGTFYVFTGVENGLFIWLCHNHPIVQDNLNQLVDPFRTICLHLMNKIDLLRTTCFNVMNKTDLLRTVCLSSVPQTLGSTVTPVWIFGGAGVMWLIGLLPILASLILSCYSTGRCCCVIANRHCKPTKVPTPESKPDEILA